MGGLAASGDAHGLPVLITVIAFFGSLNLLAVALVGEYLIKIFQEAKRRPKFIRKAIRHAGRRFAAGEALDAFVRKRREDAATAPTRAQPRDGDGD